jgi:hypothetical protein
MDKETLKAIDLDLRETHNGILMKKVGGHQIHPETKKTLAAITKTLTIVLHKIDPIKTGLKIANRDLRLLLTIRLLLWGR